MRILAFRSVLPLLLIPTSSLFLFAANQGPKSDPQAIALAAQATAALTGGNSISDVTLNANVISMPDSDHETGTATFYAKGVSESRVDVSLGSGARSDVRSGSSGSPSGAWARNGASSTAYAQHNCWTDASWFFPALSSLTQVANRAFIFKYVGQEIHAGVNTQHIQVFQNLGDQLQQHLTLLDFYLDPTSSLPLAVAFSVHPDTNATSDISSEVRFANYQTVSSAQVPFHLQQMFNGGVVLDVTVTNAAFNTGLADSLFTLP